MCLVVKEGYDIEIAQNNIKVYKLVKKHHDHWNSRFRQEGICHKYCEPITALDRRSNTIKNLKIHHPSYKDEIYEGFHSRVNIFWHKTNTICIIPKGSEICYGDDNDVVSNQLIVFKNYFQYLIYKLKKHLK